jgi:hypothetical protein
MQDPRGVQRLEPRSHTRGQERESRAILVVRDPLRPTWSWL